MRKVLLAIAIFISVVSYALHVECVGNAVLLENNGDTLLVFEKNPELKSSDGKPIAWYSVADTLRPIQTSTYLDYNVGLRHAAGYAVKVGGSWEKFWVFDYDSLRVQSYGLEVLATCSDTELKIDGHIPTIQYVDDQGVMQTMDRMCRVEYLDAMWGGDSWEDSLAVHEAVFTNSIMMGPIAIPTNYLLMDQLAELLEINDTLQFPLNNPIAIKAHPLAIVTTRPKDKSNEVSRPVDPTTLIMRSAPLEVDFKANALNADYYEWELFKGSESILRRSEAQHKYTFEQPDTYRATLKMSNSHNCECQTEDFDISVPISDIKVPNVFTPNGDGMNDEFRVVYSSIKEFHCWVYNRWGHLVYEWSDPAKGWDGSIHGKPAAEGAYYYVIRALGTDAKTDYMMKAKYSKKTKKGEKPVGVYQLSGHINLLR